MQDAPSSLESHRTNLSQRRRAADGFTLIELMVAVVIVAVLTTVAVVAYSRHVRSSRLLEAHEMVGRIQLRQEAYYAVNGVYCDAAEHPTLDSSFEAKTWNPGAGTGWTQLGVQVDKGATYFSYEAVAGDPPGFALDAFATSLGMTGGRPWYYARAQADMRQDGPPYTMVIGTSERTQAIVRDKGE